MKFFFDNCISYRYARAIHPLTDREGNSATALRDKFPVDTADAVWMDWLANDTAVWTVISQDLGDPAHPYKVSELVARNLTIFVLVPSWQRHDFWLQAQRLVRWWPVIQNDANDNALGTVHDVPFRFTRGRTLRRR